MNILFDTNVILDALTIRYENSHYSKSLFKYIFNGKIKGYVTSSQITDIHYCLRKYYKSESQRRELIGLIVKTFTVIHPLKSNIESALNSKINDFEDALLHDVARVNGISKLVTNNEKDFKQSSIEIINPKDLNTLLQIEINESFKAF